MNPAPDRVSTKDGYRVETAEGAFDCEALILCTGPWVVDAHPALQDPAPPAMRIIPRTLWVHLTASPGSRG